MHVYHYRSKQMFKDYKLSVYIAISIITVLFHYRNL